MRSPKGCFLLVVAFVLMLNNFFYAVNPATAKPIFDWLDPFAVIALVLVFIGNYRENLTASVGCLRRRRFR